MYVVGLHAVQFGNNYIARDVIQLCKENYSNCLRRKTDWALDLPKHGKASKISGDLRRSPEIVPSLRKSWEVFGCSRRRLRVRLRCRTCHQVAISVFRFGNINPIPFR